jgi:hypothetical protein
MWIAFSFFGSDPTMQVVISLFAKTLLDRDFLIMKTQSTLQVPNFSPINKLILAV